MNIRYFIPALAGIRTKRPIAQALSTTILVVSYSCWSRIMTDSDELLLDLCCIYFLLKNRA